MDTQTATLLTEDWLDRSGLAPFYTTRLNERQHKFLGRCFWPEVTPEGKLLTKGIIELSVPFVVRNDVIRVEQTIKHEICHGLTGPNHPHHGKVWKAFAVQLDVPPKACAGGEKMGGGKWIAICSHCAHIYHRYRKEPDMRGLFNCRCGAKRTVRWYTNDGEM